MNKAAPKEPKKPDAKKQPKPDAKKQPKPDAKEPPKPVEDKQQREYELMDKYFDLKHKYETQKVKRSKKKRAKKEDEDEEENENEDENEDEKQEAPLCVQCKKPGGTLFSQTKNAYSVICRARPPCGLLMRIPRSYYLPGWDVLSEYMALAETSKENIQRLKNDSTFQYLTENAVAHKFEEENAHYEATMKLLNDLKDKMIQPEREERCQEKLREVGEILDDMRVILKRCQLAAPGAINEAAEKQKRTLLPAIEELRHLKFDVTEMVQTQRAVVDGNNAKPATHCGGSKSKSSREVVVKIPQSILIQKRGPDSILIK